MPYKLNFNTIFLGYFISKMSYSLPLSQFKNNFIKKKQHILIINDKLKPVRYSNLILKVTSLVNFINIKIVTYINFKTKFLVNMKLITKKISYTKNLSSQKQFSFTKI